MCDLGDLIEHVVDGTPAGRRERDLADGPTARPKVGELPRATAPMIARPSSRACRRDRGALSARSYGVMLLCSSSPGRKIVRAVPTGGGGVELVVDLAGEVALEAAQDLLGGLAFGEPALHVGLGRLVVAQSGDHGPMQGGIGLPVAAAVEP